ncbi:MAG: 4-hydroxybutyrate CoA-transferase [Alphaproteobacteria bacterium]|nr:4-hydroxybutyrate CoA-transferase [Alphaproteobacteria bacterium]
MKVAINYDAILQEKIISASAAARFVKSGDVLDFGFGPCQPDLFDEALSARKEQLSNVLIRMAITSVPRHVIECDPQQKHFHVENWHFSGYDRLKYDEGTVSYVPMNFGEAPKIYREYRSIDTLILKTTPMDKHGFFNFGLCNTYQKALCDVAKRIIVETSESMPLAHGVENIIHINDVDAVIVGNNAALTELPSQPISEVDKKVAQFIINELEDGSCIQVGIGGMPNAVCSSLATSSIEDLGIHTEMFIDGMVDLVNAGKVTGKYKNTYPGKITYSFGMGAKSCYEFLDNNPECISLPVDLTNLPENIAANDKVISINNTMMVDLTGQAGSECIGHKHRSGTGGQLQFVRGAFASKGGKSFMCLSSRYTKGDNAEPRIKIAMPEGSIVTTPRTDIMFIVTEFGIVNLKGLSVSERALALISIAHPDDREALENEAREHGLFPKRFFYSS